MARSANPFSIYSREEDRLVAYLIREHRGGKAFGAILDELIRRPRHRSTCEQRRLLLSRPDLIRAIVADTTEETREAHVLVGRGSNQPVI